MGRLVGPPYGTTAAAVIVNKNKNWDHIIAVNTLMRKWMGLATKGSFLHFVFKESDTNNKFCVTL